MTVECYGQLVCSFLKTMGGDCILTINKTRTKLIVLLVIPSVIFSVILLSVFQMYLKNFLRETQENSMQRISEQMMYSLKGSMDQITILVLDLEQKVLKNNNDDNIKEIMDVLSKNRSKYIRGICFMSQDGETIGYPEVYWDMFAEREKKIIEENKRNSSIGIFWSLHFYSDISTGSFYNPASLVTKNVYKDKKYIGTIGLVVDIRNFLTTSAVYGGIYEIRTLLYDRNDILADSYDTQAYLHEASETEAEFKNFNSALKTLAKSNNYYTVSTMTYHPGWKIILMGDMQKLEKPFEPINTTIILVLMVGIAILFFIYLGIMWWFTRPLIQLSKGIYKVGKGNFDYRIEIKRKDEFGKVADEFNRMSELTKGLIEELTLVHEKKRQSDFNVLLSQVNPHFLYNTINSLDMMIDFSPKQEIHKAFNVLVGLLKYGLDKRSQLSTLKEEFEQVKRYIYIQSIRYGDKFELTVEDPGELQQCKIIKLILQPIVENAIFHGLHPLRDRKGRLVVSAEQSGKDLLIKVEDNGVGIPDEYLSGLFKGIQVKKEIQSTGIGIVNVHERIQLYYGTDYGLEIKSDLSAGTLVILKLPFQFDND